MLKEKCNRSHEAGRRGTERFAVQGSGSRIWGFAIRVEGLLFSGLRRFHWGRIPGGNVTELVLHTPQSKLRPGKLTFLKKVRSPLREEARAHGRRWTSNPSGKCSYERPTRDAVCGTMRSMCSADAGRLALDYQSPYRGTSPIRKRPTA